MLITFARTVILYALVVTTMRVMGKRQIGELEPYELAITIMIAELAAVPMQDRQIPLVHGFISIITLSFIQVCLSTLSLKLHWARQILDGSPSIIVRSGRIMEDEMRRARYNLNELLEQLRLKGYANLADVEIAVLETSGELSVIPTSQSRPVTPADLGLDTQHERLPIPLIMDGRLMENNLIEAGLTRDALQQELAANGLMSPKDVFFAMLDSVGKLHIQPRSGGRK
ncbi:MAG: DUF421 domain-containing protein [Firmicutes bacterium]|nr:DUF421 domain-containing protein [Bacillota bacterium]